MIFRLISDSFSPKVKCPNKGLIPLENSQNVSIFNMKFFPTSRFSVVNSKRDNSLTGFTLIELLVVIAIIGVLSAVVLASLSNARDKSANASIKANLSSIRVQSEIYFDTAGSNYGTKTGLSCTGGVGGSNNVFYDPKVAAAISAASQASGYTPVCILSPSSSSNPGLAWVVSIQLKQSEGVNATHWCVDSMGSAKARVGNPSNASGIPPCG